MLQETKESILSTITLFNGEFFKFGKVLYFTHFLSAFMFLYDKNVWKKNNFIRPKNIILYFLKRSEYWSSFKYDLYIVNKNWHETIIKNLSFSAEIIPKFAFTFWKCTTYSSRFL